MLSPSNLRRLIVAVSLIVGAAVLAGCAGADTVDVGTASSNQRYVSGDGTTKVVPSTQREDAPDISGQTLDGEPLRLADYRGKVLVLNFWASWCAPCRDEAPALAGVYEETRDLSVRFVGVNMKDSRSAAKAFERSHETPYPSLYDQPGKVALAFRETVPPKSIPTTLIIDREGRVAARILGKTTYSELLPLVTRIAGDGS